MQLHKVHFLQATKDTLCNMCVCMRVRVFRGQEIRNLRASNGEKRRETENCIISYYWKLMKRDFERKRMLVLNENFFCNWKGNERIES